MKICVIGAGFTGLTAAYYLQKNGHDVSIFERDKNPGGLAVGYKEKGWKWSLEKHYHHWFTNDKSVLNLASEINHKVIIQRPKTSAYIDEKFFQLDSPKNVLTFPKLSIVQRLRMAVTLGFLKFNPLWQPLEKFNATRVLPKTMGKKPYKMIWEPLFNNKFGPYAKNISLAWFWARIFKRTPSLAYPEGGFLNFAKHLEEIIKKNGGKIYHNVEISKLSQIKKSKVLIESKNINTSIRNSNPNIAEFDSAIVTLPLFQFLNIAPDLPKTYKNKFVKLKGLGATNLVLRLKKPFFFDNTYWLSICDPKSPIMAIVEHTNFMDKKHYNNEHIVYLGNYLPTNHPEFLMNKYEKLKLFDPYLKKINPAYQDNLLNYELFKAPFAQPIIPTNYSKMIPPIKTPFNNVYLSNIEQVYPWDRGTNYAVELGKKVAGIIDEKI